MRKRPAAEFYRAFEYNFAIDFVAVGTPTSTGIRIPANANFFVLMTRNIVNPAGAGSSISFGIAGTPGFFGTIIELQYNQNNLIANPITCTGAEVLVTVNAAPLTAGHFIVTLMYIEQH